MNYPETVLKSLSMMGENLQVARKRRKESQEQFAQRMGVSRKTLIEMERGSPLVAMGTYAMALWTIGMSEDLSEVAHPDRDIQGKVAEREANPQRVRPERPGNERYNF
jgi:DNA-binding XRE family transcriptional regulator